MSNLFKYIFFYDFSEVDVKDVESEIFSVKREPINFFFFHNKEMHFNKEVIYNTNLFNRFENIQPTYKKDGNNLVMTKKIDNFDESGFNLEVDKAYNDYLTRINYRIDCIFQTFGLFINLYKDKNLIFVFPKEITNGFVKYIDEYNIATNKIESLSLTNSDIDILDRLNYYASQNINFKTTEKFTEQNISEIFKLV